MDQTVAIGAYAAHILEIIWNLGAIVAAIASGVAGFLIGKERGRGEATKEHRRIEEDRRMRLEIRREMEGRIRREIILEDGLHLDTPRPDRAHVCKAGCNRHRHH